MTLLPCVVRGVRPGVRLCPEMPGGNGAPGRPGRSAAWKRPARRGILLEPPRRPFEWGREFPERGVYGDQPAGGEPFRGALRLYLRARLRGPLLPKPPARRLPRGGRPPRRPPAQVPPAPPPRPPPCAPHRPPP